MNYNKVEEEDAGKLLDATFFAVKNKLEEEVAAFFEEQQNQFRLKLEALFRAHTSVSLF